MSVLIIAEVKLWSPFGTRLTKNSWEEQLELASRVGDIISIHTHPIWHGSFEHVRLARNLYPSTKILAKGFHGTDEEISRALDCGADYVLVVGRQPKAHIHNCFLEALDIAELAKIPETCPMAVWNSRDLSSLKSLPGIPPFLADRWKQRAPGSDKKDSDRKKESFADARKIYQGKLCQASNIKTVADIEPGADAVLVGTHLEEFAESLGVGLPLKD